MSAAMRMEVFHDDQKFYGPTHAFQRRPTRPESITSAPE
jgi:hypothetical protein